MANSKSALVNTLLGPESSFRGEMVVDGFVRIDGFLRGSLRSNGKVVISAMARCDASIMAASAVIGGIIRGDVYVTEHLLLQDGAVIVGNIFTPRLDADTEVVIHGFVQISGDPAHAADALHAFMQKHSSGVRPMGSDMPKALDTGGHSTITAEASPVFE